MCGRRRQARTPAVLTVGRAIYNAYQDHSTQQREQAALPPTDATMMQRQPHLDQINGEVLKKAGIDPPPYTQVVMNRAEISPDPPLYEATSQEIDRNNSSGDDHIGYLGGALRTTVSQNSSTSTLSGAYQTKKELKAAYKAVRRSEKALYKAEKHAVKAERKASKATRKSCC